jgi:hypothetical protein
VIVLGQPGSRVFQWLLVAAGLLAPILHGVFLSGGDLRFRNAVSLSVLGAMALVSVAQSILLLRDNGPRQPPTPTSPA